MPHATVSVGHRVRQVPIGPYIADFICHEADFIVEIDGESHDFEARQIMDARRDKLLASKGFRTLRFTNQQIMSNLDGVVSIIRAAILAAPPSLALPRKGGGNNGRRQSDRSHPSVG